MSDPLTDDSRWTFRGNISPWISPWLGPRLNQDWAELIHDHVGEEADDD